MLHPRFYAEHILDRRPRTLNPEAYTLNTTFHPPPTPQLNTTFHPPPPPELNTTFHPPPTPKQEEARHEAVRLKRESLRKIREASTRPRPAAHWSSTGTGGRGAPTLLAVAMSTRKSAAAAAANDRARRAGDVSVGPSASPSTLATVGAMS